MHNLIGSTIGQGRYRIEARLGAGGQGEVYRGRHLTLDMPVAIKLLAQGTATDKVAQKRFEREAKLTAQLRHPSIVIVHDYGYENQRYYIVADYVKGTNLQQRLDSAGGSLPVAEALAYAQQIGGALQYAHELGTIHRDVKPSNILLRAADHQALLCDFGLALVMQPGGMENSAERRCLPGTPAYMSPEQWLARPLDARTDQYSFALVVYEMLVGRHPFLTANDTPEALCFKQVNQIPPAPSSLRRTLPSNMDSVLLKALAKDPNERYATTEVFVHELERATEQRPKEGVDAPAARAAAPRPGSPLPANALPRRQRLLGVGAAIVLVGSVAIWRGWLTPAEHSATAAPTAVRAVAPTAAPVCSLPGVCISSPRNNGRVHGQVEIRGTASIADFQFFKVEIAAGDEPQDWHVVSETHAAKVEQGVLDVLNSSSLANGVYWLRLVVVDSTGNYPEPAAVRIEIAN